MPRPLCDRLLTTHRPATLAPEPPPRQPPPGRPRLALNLILAKTSPQTNLNLPQEKHGTAQLRLRLRLRLRTSLRHPVPRPLCDRLLTTHRPATLTPEPPPRQPPPGRTRPALNLILAKTSPQTNLNLPQEKHGTAQLRLRLRLRLRTSLRHPVPRPLCDRLLTTHRPATLAPEPPPRQPPPGRPRLALNLILAKTSPQTNLNLPQEKHGTAQLRLRLRLRLSTRLRHPVPRPLCDRLLTTHRPATLAPEPPPRQPPPGRPRPALNLILAKTSPQTNLNLPQEKHGTAQLRLRLRLRLRTSLRHPVPRPLCDRLQADPATGTASPKPPPRQPPPGRPRLALNLILAKTSPQTNLNLPQEKHGTAQLRLRLRLRTRLRHPVPRPLCDRLQADPATGNARPQAIPPAAPARKTPRPALLAPSHRPGSHRQEDPAWPSTSSSQRPRHRPTSTSPRKSMAPPS